MFTLKELQLMRSNILLAIYNQDMSKKELKELNDLFDKLSKLTEIKPKE